MNNKDLRVRRTKHSLEQAMLKLLKKKDLREISIIELTDAAMISRQTFYAHYQSKEELFLACSEHFFLELNKKIIDKVEVLNIEDEEEIFDVAIKYYLKKLDDIQVLFSIKEKDLIIKSLEEPIKMMYGILGLIIDSDNEALMINLISGLTYTMISNWINKKSSADAKQVIEAMIKILSMMNKKISQDS